MSLGLSDFDITEEQIKKLNIGVGEDEAGITEIMVSSYHEFDMLISIINNHIHWNCYSKYYRGVRNKNYNLKCGLQVNGLVENEEELINAFYSAIPEKFSKCRNGFEQMALMQHYGLPTRFLDFTRNPLVALWFACQGSSNDDCAVYVAFSNVSVSSRFVDIVCKIALSGNDGLLINGMQDYLSNDDLKYYLWCLFDTFSSFSFIDIPAVDEREKNQQGSFLIGLNYPQMIIVEKAEKKVVPITQDNFTDSFEFLNYTPSFNHHMVKGDLSFFDKNRDANFILKIVLPHEEKQNCLKELAIRGITEDFIYPTPDNYAKKIKSNMINKKQNLDEFLSLQIKKMNHK